MTTPDPRPDSELAAWEQTTAPVNHEQTPLQVMAAGVAAGTVPAEVAQVLQAMMHDEQDRDARRAHFGAVADLQAELPTFRYTKHKTEGGGGNYGWTEFDELMSMLQPYLARHGLSVTFGAAPPVDG